MHRQVHTLGDRPTPNRIGQDHRDWKTAENHYPSPSAPRGASITFAGGPSWPFRTCKPWCVPLRLPAAPARSARGAMRRLRPRWAIRRGPRPYCGTRCPDSMLAVPVTNRSRAIEVIRWVPSRGGPVGPRAGCWVSLAKPVPRGLPGANHPYQVGRSPGRQPKPPSRGAKTVAVSRDSAQPPRGNPDNRLFPLDGGLHGKQHPARPGRRAAAVAGDTRPAAGLQNLKSFRGISPTVGRRPGGPAAGRARHQHPHSPNRHGSAGRNIVTDLRSLLVGLSQTRGSAGRTWPWVAKLSPAPCW